MKHPFLQQEKNLLNGLNEMGCPSKPSIILYELDEIEEGEETIYEGHRGYLA
jgi:hypothetical protein